MPTFSLLRPYRIGLFAIAGLFGGWQGPSALSAWQVQGALTIDPKIVVLEGEEGINVVKKKIAASPVVEVRDQNDLPIAGAAVVFTLPKSGPGGVFANGAKELSVVSDSVGRAAVGEMRPSGKGDFKMTVRATYKDRSVTAIISQTNFSTVASAAKAGKTPGSSLSRAPTTANVKLPPYGMAMSGGAAVGIIAVGAGLAAAAYLVLKSKGVPPPAGCLLNALTSTLTSDAATYDQDCESSPDTCTADTSSVYTDLSNFCACAGASGSLLANAVLADLSQLGLTVPFTCGN